MRIRGYGSLIEHMSNTSEARGLLQKIEDDLDCRSKSVGRNEMNKWFYDIR